MPGGLGAVFAALADGRRRYVLEEIARRGSVTATELAAELPVSRQAVAKHLAALRAAGLVRASRSGREARYALTPEPMDDAARWMEQVGAAWDARLRWLDAHLAKRPRAE
jgi:DNA-binding transcriptional ArsR family regulator